MITNRNNSQETLGIFQSNFNRGVQLLSSLIDTAEVNEKQKKQVKIDSSSSKTSKPVDKIKFKVYNHNKKNWSIGEDDTIRIDNLIEDMANKMTMHDYSTEEIRYKLMVDYFHGNLNIIAKSIKKLKCRWKVDIIRHVDTVGSSVKLQYTSRSDERMGSRIYHMEFNGQFYVIMVSYFDDSIMSFFGN